MPYHYILIDAHPVDRLNCQQIIGKFGGFHCAAEFSNAIDALSFMKDHQVDFVVVSKKLPVYDGFDFIKQLRNRPEIILFTQQANDALMAYEYGVLDCIQKPFTERRLKKGLKRMQQILQLKDQAQEIKSHKITVKSNLQTFHLDCAKILWIEATGDYIKIVLPKKTHLVHSTLKQFQEQLPDYFEQVHKSYVINLNHIRSVETAQIWIENHKIPLSRRRKAAFMERFKALA